LIISINNTQQFERTEENPSEIAEFLQTNRDLYNINYIKRKL